MNRAPSTGLEKRITQLLDKIPRPNGCAARTICALSILILFAAYVSDDKLAAQSEHAPDAPGTAHSQDIRGIWVGQLSEKMADGRVGHASFYLRLQQSGAQISGVAGDTEATASPIDNVVLSKNHLQFAMTTPRGSEDRVLWKIELDASGDAMAGKGHALRSSDSHAWDVEIKLARKG